MPEDSRPVLYLVACGAYPAGQLPAFVRDTQAQGWDVCVIATPNGAKFLDEGNIAGLSGHPVRTRYKRPDEPDLLPSPDALVVAPATFNTVNKWAQGISDTLALGLLNEAVGLGLPMIAVPWPNAALAAHPVFIRNVGLLREWGVTVLLDPARIKRGLAGHLQPAVVRLGCAHLQRLAHQLVHHVAERHQPLHAAVLVDQESHLRLLLVEEHEQLVQRDAVGHDREDLRPCRPAA